jgi:hypothetical protein
MLSGVAAAFDRIGEAYTRRRYTTAELAYVLMAAGLHRLSFAASDCAARLGQDDARHVRAPVARHRRSDQDRGGCGPGRSCGLVAD